MKEIFKLTEAASVRKPHVPGINVYEFGQTDDLLAKFDSEGIIFGRDVCATFGLLKDLDWMITQFEGKQSLLAYGVPSGTKDRSLKAATSTIVVDYEMADKRWGNPPDVRLAGINLTAKKDKNGNRPVIIAGQYGYQHNLEVLCVGLNNTDLLKQVTDKYTEQDFLNRRFFASFVAREIPIRSVGIVTEEMIKLSDNRFGVVAVKRGDQFDIGDMGEQPRKLDFPGGSNLVVVRYGGNAVLEYLPNSQRSAKPSWKVALPANLRQQ